MVGHGKAGSDGGHYSRVRVVPSMFIEETEEDMSEESCATPAEPTTPFEGNLGAVAMYWRGEDGVHMDWIKVSDVGTDVRHDDMLAAGWELLVGRAATQHAKLAYPEQPHEWHRQWVQQHAMMVVLPQQYGPDSLTAMLEALRTLLLTMPRAL